MLEKLRVWLRCWYLALRRDITDAMSTCFHCGRQGASVCSLVFPKRLCNGCATAVCRRAETPKHAHVNGVWTGSKQVAPFGHWSKRK